MKVLVVEVFVLNVPQPLTVERIVHALAELSEGGTKAVCLTCDGRQELPLKNFAHDHSNEIARMARVTYPFFSEETKGGFWSGSRGYFYVPDHIIGDRGNIFPGWEKCVNFPLAEV